MTDWISRYFALATHVSSWSKDPTTKVGCVIVGEDRRDISVGYNGFPPGVPDAPDFLTDRYVKRQLTQHAERNALDQARFSCRGALLVTTMYPCLECSKSIITRGIKAVVCPAPVDREPWRSDAMIAAAVLQSAGVDIQEWRG